jgi:hypothetical protein
MKSIKEIIEVKGFEALESEHIRIENSPYMPLVIESIGRDEKGNHLISVCHYSEQNGDAMRDPEYVFRVVTEKRLKTPTLKQALNGKKSEIVNIEKWIPVYYRNDFAGIEQDVIERPHLQLSTGGFEKIWDKNIKEQGFIQKYKDDIASLLETA